MEKLNPGYSKESVYADLADEYDDNPEDKADHDEYMADAKAWFDKIETASPTVEVGDTVEVYAKSINAFILGKITKDTFIKGNYGFMGNIRPNKIPVWEIKTKRGTLYYPQYEEGQSFSKYIPYEEGQSFSKV